MNVMHHLWRGIAALSMGLPALALADIDREALQDAWWTGPMMANSASALPQGHVLIEPYLYQVRAPDMRTLGSLTYMEYGVTDRLMLGMIPTFGRNRASNGATGTGMGDLSVLAQYSLSAFHEGSAMPAMALMVQQALPTGRYDRLDQPLADAQGGGAYTTTVQLNTQTYLWMPNGRIVRMRLNVGGSWSRTTTVDDASVYGTPRGFHGHATPGTALLVNAAWEYSLTQRWVLAFDLAYRYARGARVDGTFATDGGITRLAYRTRSSASFGFAPAVEYNWRSNVGLLLGVRVFTGGHHSATTVTPAIALNYVH